MATRRSEKKGSTRPKRPRASSVDELKGWTRDAALTELRARNWLAGGGTMFRGSPVERLPVAYGPKAEAEVSPAHVHVRAIGDALRTALAYLAGKTDEDREDVRLRRLLDRMNAREVLSSGFDSLAPWEVTAVVLEHDTIGTVIPDRRHSRKILVDAIRRERLRVGEAPIVAPRRIALLCVVAGWWPATATLAMTPKQVIALEEKSAREELRRQEKRQAAVRAAALKYDAATSKDERERLGAELRALRGRRR